MMRLTLKYGHSDWSCYAFAVYSGVESGIVRNLQAAKRFYYLTDTLIKECQSKEIKTKAMVTADGLTTLWCQAMDVGIESLKEGYTIGMECGETHFGLKGGAFLTHMQMFRSVDLSQLESDARILCDQMEDFNLDMMYELTAPRRQMILNLMGYADDPVKLTGDVIDEDDFETRFSGIRNVLGEKVFQLVRLELALHFESWNRMEEILPKLVDQRDEIFRGFFIIQGSVFVEGLVSYKLFRYTGNKKYKKHALWCTKRLEGWVKDGVFNCRPISLLLCAEKEVMAGDKKKNAAMNLYEAAIKCARQMEVLQWEAMFNERAFQVLSQVYNDVNAGIPYLEEAKKLYVQWGAHAKDDWIVEAYGRHL